MEQEKLRAERTPEVKLIAFHLPQFHTFPENDKWWGKGFTEWTNVKKATPLYPGHNQPRVPLHENYYDLSSLDTLLWQMNLARKYGVYGFCYYHYWFGGKLLLHKPLELLLQYEGEKLPYCLCWANEPWTRSWDGRVNDVLMPQEYGGEEDWEAHFQYLLPYFQDPYYIRTEEKPVLLLYRCNTIPRCDEMIVYWEKRCREYGFAGLHVVEEQNTFQQEPVCPHSQGVAEFEPACTSNYYRSVMEKVQDNLFTRGFNLLTGNRFVRVYPYKRMWRSMVKRKRVAPAGKKLYPGAFADWDNTPRKGKHGVFYLGSSPEIFGKYLKLQKKNAQKLGSQFIFLNAWNEWGEGTYLEPDEKKGYAYLEQVADCFLPAGGEKI